MTIDHYNMSYNAFTFVLYSAPVAFDHIESHNNGHRYFFKNNGKTVAEYNEYKGIGKIYNYHTHADF